MSIACFLVPAFGIACERARHPDLAGAPLALSCDRGALQVVSEDAERYGIHAGQSASSARSLCPSIALLPYDGESYTRSAQDLWDLLAIESSIVEPVSPELSFVEMSGRDIATRVRMLARDISELVKAPTLAGIGTSKLVARQAALRARPSPSAVEAFTVERGREAAFLADLPLGRLPNLDAKLLKRLERLGVRTLGDIQRIKPHELHRLCRQSGHLLRRLAQGEDGDPVRAAWPPRAIEETLRFEVEISEEALLWEALRDCAGRIAPRLRAAGDYCRLLTLDVFLEDGTEIRSEERLKEPAISAEDLFRAGVRLLQRLRLKQGALGLRLTAGGLGSGSGLQLILLDEYGNGFLHERRERLEAALRVVRKRYGEQAVVRAAMLRPARRIDLWTSPLTRSANEPVEVTVNAHGAPLLFWRKGRKYEVEAVQDRWKEGDWFGGKVVDKTAYRIVAGVGLYDLHRVGAEWRLGGVAD